MGNQHGLLQYLMLSSLDEIKQTFFFLCNIVTPSTTFNNLKELGCLCQYYPQAYLNISKPKAISILVAYLTRFYYYHILYPFRFPFILNSKLEFWGHDHVGNALCVFRNHPFSLIEDGTLNYVPYPYPQRKQSFLWIKRLIAGRCFGEHLQYAGSEKNCTRIYLTGLSDKGDVLKDPKVRIKSFVDMWNDSSQEKRLFINKVFDVSPELVERCKRIKHVLLTQPYSEAGDLSEVEKIDMYKKILSKIGPEEVAIKPHPREKTDYRACFPNSVVLDTKAPIQLLTLNGIKFESAYSINSTALFDFPYRIRVCFIGTEINSHLLERYPDWTSDKVVINNQNVELIHFPY